MKKVNNDLLKSIYLEVDEEISTEYNEDLLDKVKKLFDRYLIEESTVPEDGDSFVLRVSKEKYLVEIGEISKCYEEINENELAERYWITLIITLEEKEE